MNYDYTNTANANIYESLLVKCLHLKALNNSEEVQLFTICII